MRRESGVDGLCERGDGQRLGQSRHAFQQNVAVRQQTDQQRVDQMALTDDDLAHFGAERIDEDAFAFDALVEFLDVDDFAHCFILLNFITSFPRPACSVRHTLSGKSGSACSADKSGSAYSACMLSPKTPALHILPTNPVPHTLPDKSGSAHSARSLCACTAKTSLYCRRI